MPHNALMPVLLLPKCGLAAFADDVEENFDEKSIFAASDSRDFKRGPKESLTPIFFSQKRLNDLLKNLAGVKQKAELLASRL